MAVRIGINPITWSNDDMRELGGATPLETCLSEAREAGYSGIELGNKFPRGAAALRRLLADHGLALVSGWYSGRLLERSVVAELAAVEAHLELLLAMSCTVMIFAETTGSVAGARGTALSRRPHLTTGEWTSFGSKLTELADRLAARGIAFAYHHHMGTVVESPDEIDLLMNATGPSVGLLLDTGHLAYAGADPLAVLQRHRGRVNHVHCKDVRGEVLAAKRADDASFLDAVLAGVFTVPGDGAIDYAPILASLREGGYGGWLVVEAEQDPAKAHPLTYAKMGFAHLSRLARAAGLQTRE